MNEWLLLGVIMLSVYLLQVLFGLKQIQNFNKTYKELRSLGKVAIGKRAGKIRSGTIVMFALNKKGEIQRAVKMQGVTVLSRFKEQPQFVGLELMVLTEEHPLMIKMDKITRQTILNATELYQRIEEGDYKEEKKEAPISFLASKVGYHMNKLAVKKSEEVR
ncbi:DNA-binding transcriptional regulator of glucitol operon [Pilibacter termitis]|uniref:DNA-binding transcriptional regulator of glucitol operon n=1 Tax=Pilibacter termitis TaxID=263852 RepID=A0A1T4N5G1_9ENTE|nr:transcriptional regulator GutM [Pilibacter termitis]SJZ74472.1 DNA-binding transcriptional regulator of glucitol operon [Pilibacter termitis]